MHAWSYDWNTTTQLPRDLRVPRDPLASACDLCAKKMSLKCRLCRTTMLACSSWPIWTLYRVRALRVRCFVVSMLSTDRSARSDSASLTRSFRENCHRAPLRSPDRTGKTGRTHGGKGKHAAKSSAAMDLRERPGDTARGATATANPRMSYFYIQHPWANLEHPRYTGVYLTHGAATVLYVLRNLTQAKRTFGARGSGCRVGLS